MSAVGDPAAMCDGAASKVSKETGVPLNVLRAITRTETGRAKGGEMRPWPWTVNMEGRGVWFDTEAQAQRYVFQHYRNGARSFDIGCFQINYRWHGQAFASIEQMFEPLANARYAAEFLRTLHAEHNDWHAAVGAYHSRTHKYAARYLKRYKEVHRNLTQADTAQAASNPRHNGFSLLQGASVQGQAGSLMPQGTSGGGSLFAAPDEG
ncbi:MAG: lytic transglycosylase domain-containing protein [Pseudomonadota bacterium]